MTSRELTLNSAAEIHCFNKDVQDLLRRINEKELVFSNKNNNNNDNGELDSDDEDNSLFGRDLHSLESFERKHDIYIDELAALKVQLQELSKQSELLRQKHPGDTAESVAAETDELIDRFRTLLLKTERRKQRLQQTKDYFTFMACVRDVNEWIDSTRMLMLNDQQLLTVQSNGTTVIADLFTLTQLKQEHDNLSFEMTQRDDIFKNLEAMCIQLTSSNSTAAADAAAAIDKSSHNHHHHHNHHPNKRDILLQTDLAMKSRESLFRLWKCKNDLLDALLEISMFYRELTQLFTALNSQENLLNKSYNEMSKQQQEQQLIHTVEQLEDYIKQHEQLEKKIDKQSLDKTEELVKMGAALIDKEKKRIMLTNEQQHQANESLNNINECTNLKLKLENLSKKQDDVYKMCSKRSKQLNDALTLAILRRDVDEFEAWINERTWYAKSLKLSGISTSNSSNALSTTSAAIFLNDKLKLFQKQKALGAEIETNKNRFEHVNINII
jgi:hypothetical protein